VFIEDKNKLLESTIRAEVDKDNRLKIGDD